MTMGDNQTHTATNPRDRRADPTGIRNREERQRETRNREQRRREMQDTEGHAGSTPRGNQPLEREKTAQRRGEYDEVLGH